MKTCYVLIGPPGSGKTTFTNQFNKPFVRISQDTDGKNHYRIFLNAIMNSAENIIIDRMNFNVVQRCRYALPAAYLGYHIIYVIFNISPEESLRRCLARKNHKTIIDENTARSAINHFFDNVEDPDSREPYNRIDYGT